jgi:hypothetical protein
MYMSQLPSIFLGYIIYTLWKDSNTKMIGLFFMLTD